MAFINRHAKVIEGYTAPGFESLKTLFERQMNSITEKDAQLCVYYRGRKVIDLWAHPVNSTSFRPDSLVPVFSSGKTLEAIGLAHLIDLGLLSYDDKIAKHWPEFGTHGKDVITVADLMRHEAGLVEFDHTFKHHELLTENIKQNSVGRVIENVRRRIADSSLFHRQYHGVTRGWIVNELFRRVEPNSRTLGEYIREDIAGPLGIDVNIGLTEEHAHRRADIKPMSMAFHVIESLRPRALGRRVVHNTVELYFIADAIGRASLRDLRTRFLHLMNRSPDATAVETGNIQQRRKRKLPRLPMVFGFNGPVEGLFPYRYREAAFNIFNSLDILKGESPSMSATCTARGLARLGAMMAAGGVFEGRRFFGKEAWQALHSKKKCLKMDGAVTTHFTQGGLNYFSMEGADNNSVDRGMHKGREGFYGWMGAGGSIFQWNPDLEIGFAFVPTSLHIMDLFNERGKIYQEELVRCIEAMEQGPRLNDAAFGNA